MVEKASQTGVWKQIMVDYLLSRALVRFTWKTALNLNLPFSICM